MVLFAQICTCHVLDQGQVKQVLVIHSLDMQAEKVFFLLHFANMAMQYSAISKAVKNDHFFDEKKKDFLIFV